ncbi:hypothetical protein HDV04_003146 [Boothiomyces sp. JEL0838]|nr:hypothetical protein HDV04_003146 [Boothiomyces sp. JEL0838]
MSIEYILAAEFDIDKGSSFSFQYPENIPTEDYGFQSNLISEWSAVSDNEDQIVEFTSSQLKLCAKGELLQSWYSIFKKANIESTIRFGTVDDRVYCTEFLTMFAKIEKVNETFPRELEILAHNYCITPPLLYVLNIVGTRQIAGARRGARLKSIAIAFRKPWVHVFRPVILLALDKFFNNPSLEILKEVYEALQSFELQKLPMLTFSERKTIRSFLRNKVAHLDNDFSKILPNLDYYDPEDPSLKLTDTQLEFELPIKYSGVTLPLKLPMVAYESEIGDFSMVSLMNLISNMQISNVNQGIRSKNNVPFCWHPHLDVGPTTHPLLILIFALISEKRIIFVGHGKPCKEVNNCVLSCIALASGGDLLPGVVNRCYPYASLANIEILLSEPGFIAGVTNPVFEEQSAWWDLCINLNTGKMTISPLLIKQAQTDSTKEVSPDTAPFCLEDEQLVQSVFEGLKRHVEENHIRQILYQYVERFVEMVGRYSLNTKLNELQPIWSNRAEGWIRTNSYNYLKQRGMRFRKSLFYYIDVQALIHDLQFPSSSNSDKFMKTFLVLDQIVQEASDAQLVEILSYLTSSDGSCLPFAYGLYHERREIRLAAARIILRLFIQKLGYAYVNPFIKITVVKLLDSTAVEKLLNPLNTSLKIQTELVPKTPAPLSATPVSLSPYIPQMPNTQTPPSNSKIQALLQSQNYAQRELQKELSISLDNFGSGFADALDSVNVNEKPPANSVTDSFLDLYDYRK